MDERKMILDMLKAGDITTEEAIRLLEAVDGKKESTKKNANHERLFQFDAEKAKEGWTEIEKSLGGFVSNFVNAVFDEDFVFSLKGKYDSFVKTQKFNISEADHKEIRIDNKNGRIEILPTEGEDITIESKISHKNMEVTDKTVFYHLNEENGTIAFESALSPEMEKKCFVDLKLFVPQNQLDVVNLITTNNGITVDGLHAKEMHFETKNAKISAKNLEGEKLVMKNSNARFELAQSKVKVIDLKTTNGKVSVEEVSGQHLAVHTSNGRIATRDIAFEEVSLNTSNGTVIAEEFKTEALKEGIFTCTNGKIDIQCADLSKEVSLDLHTTNGNIDLELPLPLLYESNPSQLSSSVKAHTDNFTKENGIELFARTSNGSIVIHS